MNPDKPTYGPDEEGQHPGGDFRPGFLRAAFSQEPDPAPPAAGWAHLERELHPTRTLRPWMWMIAALLAGIGILAGIVTRMPGRQEPVAEQQAPTATRPAPPAERDALRPSATQAQGADGSVATAPAASGTDASSPEAARRAPNTEKQDASTNSVPAAAPAVAGPTPTPAPPAFRDAQASPGPVSGLAGRRVESTVRRNPTSPESAADRQRRPAAQDPGMASSLSPSPSSAEEADVEHSPPAPKSGASPAGQARRQSRKALIARTGNAPTQRLPVPASQEASGEVESKNQTIPSSTTAQPLATSALATGEQATKPTAPVSGQEPASTQPAADLPAAIQTGTTALAGPALADSAQKVKPPLAVADSAAASPRKPEEQQAAAKRRLLLELGLRALIRDRTGALEARPDRVALAWQNQGTAPQPGIELFGNLGLPLNRWLVVGGGLGLGGWREQISVEERHLQQTLHMTVLSDSAGTMELPYGQPVTQRFSWYAAQAHAELWLRLAPARVPVQLQAGPSLDAMTFVGATGPAKPSGTYYLPGLAAQVRYAPGRFFIEAGLRTRAGTSFVVPGYYRLSSRPVATFGIGFRW